ncbi:MAG: hypothetical protein HY719_16500, partial [Planctomycetes bacterium]|nr:hypothetical protein [Planctomycetota bacterium]
MASDVRSEAAQALREARARLLTTLAEEVLTWKKTSAEDSSWDGALGFEFQELADRFSPRLATLNQFICNLEEGSSPSAAPQEAPDAAVRTRLFHVDDVAMGMARFLARYRKDRIIDIAVQALDAETVLVNLFLLPSEKLAEGRDQADIIDQWVRGVRETAERRRARRAAPRPPPAPASSPAPTAPTRTPAVPIPRLILAPSPAGVAAAGAGRPAVPSLATTASASRAEQDRPPTPD